MVRPRPSRHPRPEPEAVLARAAVRAAEALGLPQRRLARVLGVSEATVSRVAAGRGLDPAGKSGELAILFVRLFRSLDTLCGGDPGKARAWLHAPNRHLGAVPADRIETVSGLVDVVTYLDALRGRL